MNKLVFKQKHTVKPQETALAVGSGSLEVFSTPSLSALMENTAIQALAPDLDEGETTVGAEMYVEHLKASKVGEILTAKAEVKAHEGRSIFITIEVKNECCDVVGRAKHTRVVVNPEKFMQRLDEK
ncbi:MAG: hypothetical protein IJ382_05210 [Flavobacteriales bacterium]|jgi:thioesterase family protein|nr:hypothetical protein [Flavobacteriales bacterium]PWM12236.1 MAG: hypothetical protein DBY00_02800 [Flavobacteriales bacterium]